MVLLSSCKVVVVPTHPNEEVCTIFTKEEFLGACFPAKPIQDKETTIRRLFEMNGATCRLPAEETKHKIYVKSLEAELNRIKKLADEAQKNNSILGDQ